MDWEPCYGDDRISLSRPYEAQERDLKDRFPEEAKAIEAWTAALREGRPGKASFAMHALISGSYLQSGAWYPVGGGAAFAEHILPTIIANDRGRRNIVSLQRAKLLDGPRRHQPEHGDRVPDRAHYLRDGCLSVVSVSKSRGPRCVYNQNKQRKSNHR